MLVIGEVRQAFEARRVAILEDRGQSDPVMAPKLRPKSRRPPTGASLKNTLFL